MPFVDNLSELILVHLFQFSEICLTIIYQDVCQNGRTLYDNCMSSSISSICSLCNSFVRRLFVLWFAYILCRNLVANNFIFDDSNRTWVEELTDPSAFFFRVVNVCLTGKQFTIISLYYRIIPGLDCLQRNFPCYKTTPLGKSLPNCLKWQRRHCQHNINCNSFCLV